MLRLAAHPGRQVDDGADRGGEQIHHSRHFRAVRADPYRASALDGGFPGLDRGEFQLVRLHSRAVG
jgi:hypothetical protein